MGKNMSNKSGKYVFDSDKPKTRDISSTYKISVVTNLKDFKDFFNVHWLVYKDDEHWVPPIWQEVRDFFKSKNPFWTHGKAQLFVAYKDNVPVGRIAAIIDYSFTKSVNENIGYFGFFECIKDFDIALLLYDASQEWLKSKGMSVIQGPINGRIDIGCGFLYEGFGSTPFIFSSYSPKYYIDFVEKYGMEKSRDQLVYYLDLEPAIPQYLKNASEKCEAKNIKIRGFDRLHTKKEMDWWVKLMMETFSHHWGYVNVSEEEVRTRFGVKQARWIVDSGLFLVAENADGKPIAFKWSTPDYNQALKKLNGNLGFLGILKFFWYKRKINKGRFNFVGIEKEYRGQSIGSCMNYYTMLEMKKRGYPGAECGWIDEKNIASQRTIEKTGAKPYKKYRVHKKTID
jgi:ribosomal protein S18 acetylase RimI-like enzyme